MMLNDLDPIYGSECEYLSCYWSLMGFLQL